MTIADRNMDPPGALLDLGRRATVGEVSSRHHVASRARLLERWDGGPRGSGSPTAQIAFACLGTACVVAGGMTFGMFRYQAHHAETAATAIAPVASVASAESTADPLRRREQALREAALAAAASPAEDAEPALTIQAFPDDATILFDDEELEGNPAKLTREPDGKWHRIRAKADGYITETESLVFDAKNVTMQLKLEPIPTSFGEVSTTLKGEYVRETILAMREPFRSCYVEVLGDHPSMVGRTTLTLRVAAGGRVASAETRDTVGLSSTVTGCIVSHASEITFDHEPQAGTVKVPLTFGVQPKP